MCKEKYKKIKKKINLKGYARLKELKKSSKGITLIALVITIIVLLILAGVTIATLTGENGILTKAGDAKEQTEKGEEREKVELSATGAKTINNGGEITQENLETELGKYFAFGKYNVTLGTNEDEIEGYIVTITENDQNGRKYFVDRNGNVTEYIEMEQGQPEGTNGSNFGMKYGTVELEFLNDTGYTIGEANEPLLDETTMIPIKYNEETSKWRATTKDDPEWYNYDETNRKWANVMLSDGTYTVENVPKDRDLEESELGSMFVWIPRYVYKIVYFANQTDKETYISGGRTDTSKIIGYSDARGIVDVEGKVRADITENITGIKVGENYRAHPVFENNVEQGGWDEKLTGIWVGKFETTTKTSTNGANMILPNQTSQRSLKVSTTFSRAQKIGKNLNMTLDSHIMKNTEWGAVAYLTESKYGRNGTEVSVNQCSSFITGSGRGITGDNPIYNSTYNSSAITDEQKHNGNIGILSSTTGNVYGIYDISGGAWEWVMGMYQDSAGNIHTGFSISANSGFNGYLKDGTQITNAVDLPERKYYNLYTAENNTNIGDALYETKGWNHDKANFVDSSAPFFYRGGYNGETYGSAGMFMYGSDYGDWNNSFAGFRVCLAVQ